MRSDLCPKCFEPTGDSVVYACSTPGCSREGEAQPAEEANRDEKGTPLCNQCGGEMHRRKCSGCGYLLPESDGSGFLLPFSVIGAQGSGKSNFLSVLVDSLKNSMGKAYNCALYPVDGEATMDFYDREYHDMLFRQGRILPSTVQDNVEPLRYALVFSGEQPAGKTCTISLYDSCGASFESEKDMVRFNRAMLYSSGILLMIDPTQLPRVRDQYRQKQKPILDVDIVDLLTRTIHVIRSQQGLKNVQQKIEIPLAVCLTKLDSIMDQNLLDPASFIAYPSRHLGQPWFDRIDFESCNLEVQSLMESWGGRELLRQIQAQFSCSGFFALSSLGGAPDPTGRISRVMPHRVLDPILWLLWKNSVIQSK